jgi:D-alanine-D-alanine ligase
MGRVLDVGIAGDTHARRAGVLAHALERLRPQLRLAVIYGGNADAPGAVMRRTHNPRPWKSYEAVARDIAGALDALGFARVEAFPEDKHLAARLAVFEPHLVWLNTAGAQGDAPMAHAPALLEMLGIPYVGSSPLNAATLDAKHVFKTQLQGLGLPTAPFATWDASDRAAGAEPFARILSAHTGPFVVKPVHGRASLHVEIAETRADLPRVVEAVAARSGSLALIEPFLGGAEYCVSVMGPVVCRGGNVEIGNAPFAFSAIERCLAPEERIAPSIDCKPITPDAFRLLERPADEPVRAELAAIAADLYRRMRLESIVRIDLRRDATGRMMVLEANPKPDLKRPDGRATSLVSAGLVALGMSYEDLILSILANRLADYLFRIPRAAPQLMEMVQ